jgi:hypothetical protein
MICRKADNFLRGDVSILSNLDLVWQSDLQPTEEPMRINQEKARGKIQISVSRPDLVTPSAQGAAMTAFQNCGAKFLKEETFCMTANISIASAKGLHGLAVLDAQTLTGIYLEKDCHLIHYFTAITAMSSIWKQPSRFRS